MEVCEENSIQLIGYSSLGLGLLTDKYSIDKLPTGPRAILFREYLPGMKVLLDELRDIAKARNKSVPQVSSLIFIISKDQPSSSSILFLGSIELVPM